MTRTNRSSSPTHEYVCRACEVSTEYIVQPPDSKMDFCSRCHHYTLVYKNYLTLPKKRKKRRPTYEYVKVTKKQKKALEKKAKEIGCSVHSLVVNFIDRGLNPPLIQTQTGYIPAPVQRPPAVGLPPSRKKNNEKDPLIIEVEKHPMFIRQKKKYG